MKIIFLDFDGVINNSLYDPNIDKIRYFFPETDEKVNNQCAIGFLNKLIIDTSAVIVVSSTWRIGESIESLQQMLNDSGCIGKVIDKTCSLSSKGMSRGHEIKWWLDTNKDVESYVILDDMWDMLSEQNKNFVKCNDDYGFLFPEYKRALKILNNEDVFDYDYI